MNLSQGKQSVVLLVAEDDDEDFFLLTRALEKLKVSNQVVRFKDGQELMDYLHGLPQHALQSPHSYLIFLDLNMPRKDGREALQEIKNDSTLKRIPVIVFTTSQAEEDVVRSYNLGVNSFIRKPVMQQEFVDTISVLTHYWLEIVEMPNVGA